MAYFPDVFHPQEAGAALHAVNGAEYAINNIRVFRIFFQLEYFGFYVVQMIARFNEEFLNNFNIVHNICNVFHVLCPQ